MSKKKPIPKSQYRKYQTKSRADQQEQVQSSKQGLLIAAGVVAIVVILAIIYVLNSQSNQSGTTDLTPTDRPLSDLSPAERSNYFSQAPEMQIDPTHDYQAIIATEHGDITLDLFEQESPLTVNNFVFLARQGFYDGLTFHRVIEDFMAQGGDPSGNGAGGPGYQFEDEVNNGLAFDQVGLLAMANSGPNTNGSQFFITYSAQGTAHLTRLHTIFGEVIEGMDAVHLLVNGDSISHVTILEDGEES